MQLADEFDDWGEMSHQHSAVARGEDVQRNTRGNSTGWIGEWKRLIDAN